MIYSIMKTSFKIYMALLLMGTSCISNVDRNTKKFTLNGEINGQDSGIVVLLYYSDPNLIRDTAIVEKGKFVFTGKIVEPTQATIRDGEGSELSVAYLEPGKMNISIFKNQTPRFKLTGSKTQEEDDILIGMLKPLYAKMSDTRVQISKLNDSIANDPEKIYAKEIEKLNKILSIARGKIDSIEIKYVTDNPDSYISLVYLKMLNANDEISLDTAKSMFAGISNNLKSTSKGKLLHDDIRRKENICVGVQAPEFKAKDINGQTIELSQFKGKSVILLDFWASWCVPCRESIPHLKKLYEKYHSKGFEIIAISMDTDRESWINAVNKDSTGIWYHVPVAEQYAKGPSYFTDDDIYKNYFVQAIPATIVIDKNGKILSRLVGRSKENEERLNNLLANVFSN